MFFLLRNDFIALRAFFTCIFFEYNLAITKQVNVTKNTPINIQIDFGRLNSNLNYYIVIYKYILFHYLIYKYLLLNILFLLFCFHLLTLINYI